jgi:bifunctional UDP-N-acetylglucosamine pyrophosphorylase/glucosamine-1-phosphate N-acetyltransferase
VKAVILAAGRSTRTYPLTITRPKPLLPVLNRPLLGYNLQILSTIVEGFVLVVGYYASMIETVFGKHYRGIPIEYAYQKDQLGTADAVLAAKEFVEEGFLLLNGDDIYGADDLKATAESQGNAVLGVKIADSSRFGMLVAEGTRLVNIAEKPETPFTGLANAGLYRLTLGIFGYLSGVEASPRGEFEFVDAVTALAGDVPVKIVKSAGGFLSIGSPADLLEAQKALWPGGSYLEGRYCRVSPSASIGPTVTIGDSCAVGRGASLSNSIIFDGVNIGGDVKIKDSVLGSTVAVGEGALLEAAVVGDNAMIGPEAHIGPGSRVWPGVTVPGGAEVSGECKGSAED